MKDTDVAGSSVPQVHSVASPKTQALPVPDPSPVLSPALPQNQEDLEKKIRHQVEMEYKQKMEQFQTDLKYSMEQFLKEHEAQALEREKMLSQGKDEISKLQQELRAQYEQAMTDNRRQLEAEMMRKLEEEKLRLEGEKKEILESAQKQSEMFKLELAHQEELVRQRQKELEEKHRSANEQMKTPNPSEVKPGIPALPIIPQQEPPAAAAPSEREADAGKWNSPALTDHFPIEIPKEFNTASVKTSGDLRTIDKAAEARARWLYSSLRDAGSKVFTHLGHSEDPEIGSIAKLMGDLIDLIEGKDAEVISISLEPYPEGGQFVGHALNVAILSLALSLEFDMSRDQRKELALAAFFHDVGLLNTMEDLSYPRELNAKLQKDILEHPIRGEEMMRAWLSESSLIAIRQHHEVGNGKGYPHRLKASDIHLYAHIIHIIDAFEALTHERPYRKRPLDVHDAVKEIIESGRNIYERSVLKALMTRIGLYPVLSLVELSSKQIARVVKQNRDLPISPVVQVEFDEHGHKLEKPQVLDLSRSQFVHITGPAKKESTVHSRSQFVHAKHQRSAAKEAGNLLKDVLSIVMIIAVVAILIYVVITI